MAKLKTEYRCKACDAKFVKWSGRCGACGEWDSIQEHNAAPRGSSWIEAESRPQKLSSIKVDKSAERWETQVYEFDRVAGGGIVKGSIGLLGGTPGVGKSTLLLQLLSRLGKMGLKVLYVSGEESAGQIKHRAQRLLIEQDNILISIEPNLEAILENLKEHRPDFAVIDSIQTLRAETLSSAPGSVSQVRETASILTRHAKQTNTAVMLAGHVTKDGDVAGPRTLEHMVDYVFYLEGEKKEERRTLRAVKNRFGSINELGIFKMTSRGLAEVRHPNNLFVQSFVSDYPGVAIFASNEGARTLFLEVQALVGDTQQNHPARSAMGVDRNRLQLILAIMEKHLRMDFSRNDVHINLAGGFRVSETAGDLPLTAAILSSHLNFKLPAKTVFIGEAALSGEFRSVPAMEARLRESDRQGFQQAFIPSQNLKPDWFSSLNLKPTPVKNVQELLDILG